MKTEDFNDLVESIREAGRIKRGHAQPSRVHAFRPIDVQKIRARLKCSQRDFADLIGVSVATLQNWEQGRRTPHGPAQALLRVAAHSPHVVAEALGQVTSSK